ncbi:MAG: hypothetical protein WEE89_06345, partial [Gemmatimonadota bacterium]
GREVVNPPECGLAVDSAATGDLADAIVRLISPGVEWDNWSHNSLKRYTDRYTATAFQRRLVRALWHG